MALLLDEAPHLPNPNTARISDNLWRFWCCYLRRVPGARLGGIYANKVGYHNYRNAISSRDYSSGRDVTADTRGSGNYASAIDLTLNETQMRDQTLRLDKAARDKDVRLYVRTGPTLREFIGTKNGTDVYCWVFTGGRPLGVQGDSGVDYGRDKSHLWHVHLSIIRQYSDDRVALDGVLSVIIGESPAAWEARTKMGGNDVGQLEGDQAVQLRDTHYTTARAIPNPTGGGKVPLHVWAGYTTELMQEMWTAIKAIAQQLPEVDNQVAANMETQLSDLRTRLDARLSEVETAVEATPEEVVSLLGAQDANDGAQLLITSIGEVRAKAFRDALNALLPTE